MKVYHVPVLEKEVLGYLAIRPGAWYLDCTLGDGGHSLGILHSGGNVCGIDQDPEAFERVKERFTNEGIEKDRYSLLKGNFRKLSDLVSEFRALREEIHSFAGVLFDLGISSYQLDSGIRGFSFAKDARLDMRMDPGLQISALELVNLCSERELRDIFWNLGKERFSKVIARKIVEARRDGQVVGTWQLARIIESGLPFKDKSRVNHFLQVFFQALRIQVNGELEALSEALPQALDASEGGGTLAVISFHSLEDRITKNVFREWSVRRFGELVAKKPIRPSLTEIQENPRSRSAKLRVFKKYASS